MVFVYHIWFVVILFKYRFYTHNYIFKHIKRKHGKDIFTVVKSFEDLKTKYEKILLDFKFLKTCKKGNLLPTFAKVRLSIKNANCKLMQRIGRIIMEDELQRKHHEKLKIMKDIKAISIDLKSCFNFLIYCMLLHKINIAVELINLINIQHAIWKINFKEHWGKQNPQCLKNFIQNSIHQVHHIQVNYKEQLKCINFSPSMLITCHSVL